MGLKNSFKNVATELNLKYDSKGSIIFGSYKGYKVTIQYNKKLNGYCFNIPLKESELTRDENMDAFINELLEDKKSVAKASYEEYCLKILLTVKFTAKQELKSITDILNKVEDFAKNNHYTTSCEICGEDMPTSINLINNIPFCTCEKCYGEIIGDLDDAQINFKNQKNNIVSGTVGAFLGSLIGVALWVVIYAIGYIASICGIVLAICAIKGYKKFGGKLDKAGIIITILVTIFMVYVANYISYGYEVYIAFKEVENINLLEAIRSVGFLVSEYEDFGNSFIGDLVFGYFFTLIGTVTTFINAYKEHNFKYKTRKLHE